MSDQTSPDPAEQARLERAYDALIRLAQVVRDERDDPGRWAPVERHIGHMARELQLMAEQIGLSEGPVFRPLPGQPGQPDIRPQLRVICADDS